MVDFWFCLHIKNVRFIHCLDERFVNSKCDIVGHSTPHIAIYPH